MINYLHLLEFFILLICIAFILTKFYSNKIYLLIFTSLLISGKNGALSFICTFVACFNVCTNNLEQLQK